MEKDNIFIVGASGFAAEVTEYIEDNNSTVNRQIKISGYFDTNDKEYTRYSFDAPFLGNEKKFDIPGSSKVIVAIANSGLRAKLFDFFKSKKCDLPSFIHHSCFISKRSHIGEGSILCPFVTVTANVTIGIGFQANIYSYIAHDCVIGDYVTFAPAVKCNGNVEIGDNVYIGTGAIIKQGTNNRPLKIGKNAIVGAGAVVTKNVPEGMTVFGNPAIELTKENLKRRN
ncbi:Acetyltransferase (isoleucine patch superfamily) [hydrothermal vent metagenome]|uniref:Acetyltransferase (Isoleucine patch superfamily) n=1 Tax=hydrothermal vent metagenome TaxID=652676 RepID=A0A1W1BNS8_9ZZZZ